MKKTYCLTIALPSSGDVHAPVWRNFVFTNLVGGSAPAHSVSCVRQVRDGSDCRRGYYGDRAWDIKKPLRGSENQMMIRFDAPMSYDIEDDMDMTQWERTTLALVRAQVVLASVVVVVVCIFNKTYA